MKKYETKYLSSRSTGEFHARLDLVDQMNLMGAQGWRVVCRDLGGTFYQREVPDTGEEEEEEGDETRVNPLVNPDAHVFHPAFDVTGGVFITDDDSVLALDNCYLWDATSQRRADTDCSGRVGTLTLEYGLREYGPPLEATRIACEAHANLALGNTR